MDRINLNEIFTLKLRKSHEIIRWGLNEDLKSSKPISYYLEELI